MARKAKLKSTGEIIDVRVSMDRDGNTTWIDSITNTEYYPQELEFLPVIIGALTPINDNSPFKATELVAYDPMQITHDKKNSMVYLSQCLQVRLTEGTVQAALQVATDKQLQDELKRRANERKAMRGEILRCRDCKHCGEGLCHKGRSRYKTTVCFKQLKPQAGEDRYYATNHSRKACEKFEPKII